MKCHSIKLRALGLLLIPAAGLQLGCGAEENVVESKTSALAVGERPAGFTCGLAYSNSSDFGMPSLLPVNGRCMGFSTLNNFRGAPGTPSGFAAVRDGDAGLPGSILGFFHQYQTASTGDTSQPLYSEILRLPKGTACGLRHTGSCQGTNSLRCLGHDPAVSCPNGWQRKQASDIGGSNGCHFAWCEYQDPWNVCTSNDCVFNLQPTGIVCGLSDTDYPALPAASPTTQGRCMGEATPTRCPTGWTWQRYGNYDDERPSNHGLTWCTKV
jgi:hypothetical protein